MVAPKAQEFVSRTTADMWGSPTLQLKSDAHRCVHNHPRDFTHYKHNRNKIRNHTPQVLRKSEGKIDERVQAAKRQQKRRDANKEKHEAEQTALATRKANSKAFWCDYPGCTRCFTRRAWWATTLHNTCTSYAYTHSDTHDAHQFQAIKTQTLWHAFWGACMFSAYWDGH